MSKDLIYRKIVESMVDLDPREHLPPREQRLKQALHILMPELEDSDPGN